MDYLATNNFDQSFKLLKNAEKILMNENHGMTPEARNKLLSLTFNNMGCYYKKKEKPNVALFYLKNSLEIEQNDPKTEKINLAGTHLNLCAIYSKLSKHSDSTRHAKFSIHILEALIQQKEQQKQQKTASQEQQTLQVEEQKRVQFDEITIQKTVNELDTSLKENNIAAQKKRDEERKQKLEENNLYLTEAIAYYNLGASYEHQNKLEQCLKSYQIAQQIAKVHLGETHPLYSTINESMKKVEDKKKQTDTSHMLRDYLRKEKAASSIFKNGSMNVMFKRLQRQSQIAQNGQQNNELLSDITSLSPLKQSIPALGSKKINLHKRGNSTKIPQRKQKLMNQTQLNSINNSLVDINSIINQDTIFNGETEDKTKFQEILAISNQSQAVQQQQDSINQRRFSSPDVQNDTNGNINFSKMGNSSLQIKSSLQTNQQNQQPRIMIRKPQTAKNGVRSRSNRYATTLVSKANKFVSKLPSTSKNIYSNQSMFDEAPTANDSRPITQNGSNAQNYYSSSQEPKDLKIKSIYSYQSRLPIDIESIRYDQISPQVMNGFPQEKSLTRLNRRLQSLDVQVQGQFNQ